MGARLLLGDCLAHMQSMEEGSVDAVVTDPPYGLSDEPDPREVLKSWLETGTFEHGKAGVFGREWDSFVPGPVVWREAFNLLRPGGHLIAFAGSRTVDWTSIALRLAGFEIRDMGAWVYHSGKPAGLAVDLAIDRQRNDRDLILQVTGWVAEQRDAKGLTNQAIDEHFGTAGMAGHWTSLKSQPSIPKPDQWAALCALLGVRNDEIDALVAYLNGRKGEPGDAYHEREVVGEGHRIRRGDGVAGRYGGLSDGAFDLTAPASEEAKAWEGWGTRLKPSFEPFVIARRPLSGTVAQNVIAHGVGGINIGRWPANALYCPKASRAEREWGCDGLPEVMPGIRNAHVSVKPLRLIRWMVRLVTPRGGLVLDPYMGSGTTGIAAVGQGFGFVGCEMEQDSMRVACARVGHAAAPGGLDGPPSILASLAPPEQARLF